MSSGPKRRELCGAPTARGGEGCQNPRGPNGRCRWHPPVSAETPSDDPAATDGIGPTTEVDAVGVVNEVDWDAIVTGLRRRGVGTEFDPTRHEALFHPPLLNVDRIVAYEKKRHPTAASKLYRQYYPEMRVWSAKGLATMVKSYEIVNRIGKDISAASKRAWSAPENAEVVAFITSARFTYDDLKVWYDQCLNATFLSSVHIRDLLVKGKITLNAGSMATVFLRRSGSHEL